MKNLLSLILLFCSIFLYNSCSHNIGNPEISIEELKEHINYLASDSLKGRKPGTPEGKLAAEYIKEQFKTMGLKPLGDNYFQYFDVVTDVKTGNNNTLSFKGFNGKLDENFAPYSYSGNGKFTGSVVFAGYGFDIDTDSINWNDYENIDVTGKWVMILQAIPELDNPESKYIQYSDETDKVLTAKDKGAVGVLFVSGLEFDKEDKLVSLYFERSSFNAGLPVINITRDVANKLLEQKGKKIKDLEKEINNNLKPASFEISTLLTASTEVFQEKVTTQNVVGLLEG
ncbi:MAG: hypothetical protein K8R58_11670, partial [Bacteroidales bacterium]|nr:hypothetical protein [Bacteroidales bacterium]